MKPVQVLEPEDLSGLGEEERRAVLTRRRNRVNAANCRQRQSARVEDLARTVEGLRAEVRLRRRQQQPSSLIHHNSL